MRQNEDNIGHAMPGDVPVPYDPQPVENMASYDSPTKNPSYDSPNMAGRPRRLTAREILLLKANDLRRRASHYEALARAIPQDISEEANAALHFLIGPGFSR